MLLHLHGVAADAGQIRHRLGTDKIGAPEMLRCAKDLGLKARACRTDWSRLVKTPLPAIATLYDGGFLVVAKAAEDKVLVQPPQASRPALMTRVEVLAGGGRGRKALARAAAGARARLDAGVRVPRGGGGRVDPDAPRGRIGGCHPPVRYHLVSRRNPQISSSPERGAARVVLPAADCPGLAA